MGQGASGWPRWFRWSSWKAGSSWIREQQRVNASRWGQLADARLLPLQPRPALSWRRTLAVFEPRRPARRRTDGDEHGESIAVWRRRACRLLSRRSNRRNRRTHLEQRPSLALLVSRRAGRSSWQLQQDSFFPSSGTRSTLGWSKNQDGRQVSSSQQTKVWRNLSNFQNVCKRIFDIWLEIYIINRGLTEENTQLANYPQLALSNPQVYFKSPIVDILSNWESVLCSLTLFYQTHIYPIPNWTYYFQLGIWEHQLGIICPIGDNMPNWWYFFVCPLM